MASTTISLGVRRSRQKTADDLMNIFNNIRNEPAKFDAKKFPAYSVAAQQLMPSFQQQHIDALLTFCSKLNVEDILLYTCVSQRLVQLGQQAPLGSSATNPSSTRLAGIDISFEGVYSRCVRRLIVLLQRSGSRDAGVGMAVVNAWSTRVSQNLDSMSLVDAELSVRALAEVFSSMATHTAGAGPQLADIYVRLLNRIAKLMDIDHSNSISSRTTLYVPYYNMLVATAIPSGGQMQDRVGMSAASLDVLLRKLQGAISAVNKGQLRLSRDELITSIAGLSWIVEHDSRFEKPLATLVSKLQVYLQRNSKEANAVEQSKQLSSMLGFLDAKQVTCGLLWDLWRASAKELDEQELFNLYVFLAKRVGERAVEGSEVAKAKAQVVGLLNKQKEWMEERLLPKPGFTAEGKVIQALRDYLIVKIPFPPDASRKAKAAPSNKTRQGPPRLQGIVRRQDGLTDEQRREAASAAKNGGDDGATGVFLQNHFAVGVSIPVRVLLVNQENGIVLAFDGDRLPPKVARKQSQRT